MIMITGDRHGNINDLQGGKGFIILGDIGIDYNDYARKDCYNVIRRNPDTLYICIRGNHEPRPANLPNYYNKVAEFDNGIVSGRNVFQAKKVPNLIFLSDGEIYEIEGKTCLVIGGAYSVDKFYRLRNGYNWFADEQLTEKEMKAIFDKVKGIKVDCVLTHTCPKRFVPTELFLAGIDQTTVDNTMEVWLDTIEENIEYQHWYFGHFHADKHIDDKVSILYKTVIQFARGI